MNSASSLGMMNRYASKKLVQALQQNGSINLAYVYKYSIHHYCLKEWLALTDPQLAKNIQLMTSPPPSMVKGIAEQVFDGFSVGDPWNIQAKLEGYSFMVRGKPECHSKSCQIKSWP